MGCGSSCADANTFTTAELAELERMATAGATFDDIEARFRHIDPDALDSRIFSLQCRLGVCVAGWPPESPVDDAYNA